MPESNARSYTACRTPISRMVKKEAGKMPDPEYTKQAGSQEYSGC
jgi:hypothetical protein